jgi:hypothetical protein
MKKKIVIGIGVLLILLVGALAYLNLVVNKRSPEQTLNASFEGLDVTIVYCRPYKKGRLIFGEKSQGALQPYGEYWRLGANAATQISFSKDVNFAGKPVKAGTYRMYAVPGADTWQVALNSELGKWGYSPPDYSLDVLKVEVKPETAPETEQFTITLSNDSSAMMMDFAWEKTRVRVPITPQ